MQRLTRKMGVPRARCLLGGQECILSLTLLTMQAEEPVVGLIVILYRLCTPYCLHLGWAPCHSAFGIAMGMMANSGSWLSVMILSWGCIHTVEERLALCQAHNGQ